MQTRLLLPISHRHSSGGSPSSPVIHPKPVAGFRRPSRYSHVDMPPLACFSLLLQYSKEGPAYSRARDRRPRRTRDGHTTRGGMRGDSASPDTFPQCTLAGSLIICCNESLPSLVTECLFPRRLSLSVRGGDFRTPWEMPSLPLFSTPCHRDDVSSALRSWNTKTS